MGELLNQRIDLPAEIALQRAQRGARRLLGSAVDQIGDGFGLGEIDFIVEKGAFAEFAGARQTRAQANHFAQQAIENHRPAMALQFEHVFAGERMRSGEKQRDTLIENSARCGCSVFPKSYRSVRRAE